MILAQYVCLVMAFAHVFALGYVIGADIPGNGWEGWVWIAGLIACLVGAFR